MTPYHSDLPTFFMHVPKVGGTSVREALCASLKPDRLVTAFDTALSGEGRFAADANRTDIIRPGENFPAADLVAAHMAASSGLEQYPSAQRITFLRVPESRLISLWLFWRSHRNEDLVHPDDRAKVTASRAGLTEFLSNRQLGFELDNVVARMLLWPDRRIQQAAWIAEPSVDVMAAAVERLAEFAYVDVIENPLLESSFSAWLGRPFLISRLNETANISPDLRRSLFSELTAEAMSLLGHLTRLDRGLWHIFASKRMGEQQARDLRVATLMRSVARHANILSGDQLARGPFI